MANAPKTNPLTMADLVIEHNILEPPLLSTSKSKFQLGLGVTTSFVGFFVGDDVAPGTPPGATPGIPPCVPPGVPPAEVICVGLVGARLMVGGGVSQSIPVKQFWPSGHSSFAPVGHGFFL